MSEIEKDPMGEDTPENDKEISSSQANDTGDEQPAEAEKSQESSAEEPAKEPDPADDGEPEEDEPKKSKRISVFAFLLSAISLILATVMITFTVCTTLYRRKLAQLIPSDDIKNDVQQNGGQQSPSDEGSSGDDSSDDDSLLNDAYIFELISQFVDAYSFEDVDKEQMMVNAIKAYVAATGDDYAYYYTDEELEAQRLASQGQNEGIGINIIESEAVIDGISVKCMSIINVVRNSPAEKAGLVAGDIIYGVGIGENMRTVDSIGYDMALVELIGKKGTTAEFTVKRQKSGAYETLEFSIVRENVTEDSVYYRVHSSDPTVGIVKVLRFDLTTPKQFSAAMDDLITKGCTNFVFDMRYNPGGDVLSIKAVLSYFLKEGDVVMRTQYKSGIEEFEKVQTSTFTDSYAGCSVSAADIGKYKRDNFKFTVLCNGSTASAGELFTATFRDYGLGKIVGTKTFGKGSMQTMFPLTRFGCEGALKLTVAKYFSGANGGYNDGYDGIGITPDIVEELAEELQNKNIYTITDEEDNQLAKALECFK